MASVDPVKGAGENHGQGGDFQVNKAPGTETGLLSLPRVTLMAAKGHSLEEPQGKRRDAAAAPGSRGRGRGDPGGQGAGLCPGAAAPRDYPGGRAQEFILPRLWQPEACGGGVSRPTLDPKALGEDPPAAPGAASPQSQLRLHKAFSPMCLSSSVQQGHQSWDLGPTQIIQGDLISRSETWLHPQRPFFQISSHL